MIVFFFQNVPMNEIIFPSEDVFLGFFFVYFLDSTFFGTFGILTNREKRENT